MPVKALPAAAWSWAGFYIGAHGGYGWKQNNFAEVIQVNPLLTLGGIDSSGWLPGGGCGGGGHFGWSPRADGGGGGGGGGGGAQSPSIGALAIPRVSARFGRGTAAWTRNRFTGRQLPRLAVASIDYGGKQNDFAAVIQTNTSSADLRLGLGGRR